MPLLVCNLWLVPLFHHVGAAVDADNPPLNKHPHKCANPPAQEADRAAKVEQLKQWQDQAQARAAVLPEYKRYIDPAIIEANFR